MTNGKKPGSARYQESGGVEPVANAWRCRPGPASLNGRKATATTATWWNTSSETRNRGS